MSFTSVVSTQSVLKLTSLKHIGGRKSIKIEGWNCCLKSNHGYSLCLGF
uniref:Uncharacterized protein n=1 Tax=Arundo donax TaxID=35708 RepID=A0A0A9CMJ8_ARUDO